MLEYKISAKVWNGGKACEFNGEMIKMEKNRMN